LCNDGETALAAGIEWIGGYAKTPTQSYADLNVAQAWYLGWDPFDIDHQITGIVWLRCFSPIG
jgi:hypothetical protein